MLYGSAKIQLHNLTKTDREDLRILSQKSRDLYNNCTSAICTEYERTNRVINYQTLKATVKDSPEYKGLGGYYFQILLSAIADFRKYISTDNYILRKSDRTLEVKNLAKFTPPHPKDDLRQIEVKNPYIDNGYIKLLPTNSTNMVRIKLPDEYRNKRIVRAYVKPQYYLKWWDMTIEYEQTEIAHSNLDSNKALGIDLGVTNYATCISTNGDSFIIDGRQLKSILQGYCKYKAKLQKASRTKKSRRLASLYKRTINRSTDYMRKSVSYIIQYCISHGIGKIVLGWGVHFQKANLGMNNQLFALMPYAKFKNALEYHSKKHGIRFVTVDESFTSLASAYDLDTMPEHVTAVKQHFSGKRVHRGLYISADGVTLNADLNGAINILRKGSVTPQFLLRLDGRGLASPKRVNPLK